MFLKSKQGYNPTIIYTYLAPTRLVWVDGVRQAQPAPFWSGWALLFPVIAANSKDLVIARKVSGYNIFLMVDHLVFRHHCDWVCCQCISCLERSQTAGK
jgi:hypothetical protein